MSLTPSVCPARLQTAASVACKCCAKSWYQVEPKIVFPSVSFVFFPFRQMLAVGTQPRMPTATLATTEGSRPSLTTGATPAAAGEDAHFASSVSSRLGHSTFRSPRHCSGSTTAASAGAAAAGETPAGWRRPEMMETGPSRHPAMSGSNSETF